MAGQLLGWHDPRCLRCATLAAPPARANALLSAHTAASQQVTAQETRAPGCPQLPQVGRPVQSARVVLGPPRVHKAPTGRSINTAAAAARPAHEGVHACACAGTHTHARTHAPAPAGPRAPGDLLQAELLGGDHVRSLRPRARPGHEMDHHVEGGLCAGRLLPGRRVEPGRLARLDGSRAPVHACERSLTWALPRVHTRASAAAQPCCMRADAQSWTDPCPQIFMIASGSQGAPCMQQTGLLLPSPL